MENFQCHKHLLGKIYRVGQPWRALHYPPLPSSSSQSDDLRLEFHWQIKHTYYSVPDEQLLRFQHIKTSRELVGFASSPVDRLAFLNDHHYSRQLMDSLVASCNSRESDTAIDWIVSKARTTFQNHPKGCKTVLIGLELIHDHICFESVLVRGVMERSFGKNGGMRPASKSSIKSLQNVDLDKYEIKGGDQSLSCVVCLDELGMSSKDKNEVLRMPCSHMFHGECVLTWLDNSHYCPICRFEMPVY